MPYERDLAPGEHAVLVDMADGYTLAEIAERRGTSRNTVRAQVTNIYAKLGARSRAQAVAIAFRGGMLT